MNAPDEQESRFHRHRYSSQSALYPYTARLRYSQHADGLRMRPVGESLGTCGDSGHCSDVVDGRMRC